MFGITTLRVSANPGIRDTSRLPIAWYKVADPGFGIGLPFRETLDNVFVEPVAAFVSEDFENFEIHKSDSSTGHWALSMKLTPEGQEKWIHFKVKYPQGKIAIQAYGKIWEQIEISEIPKDMVLTIKYPDFSKVDYMWLVTDIYMERQWPQKRTGILNHKFCHTKTNKLSCYRDTINHINFEKGRLHSYALSNNYVEYDVDAASLTIRIPNSETGSWSDSLKFRLLQESLELNYQGQIISISSVKKEDLPKELNQIPAELIFRNDELNHILVRSGEFSTKIWVSRYSSNSICRIDISNGDYRTILNTSHRNIRRLNFIWMMQQSQSADISLSSYFRKSKYVQFAHLKYMGSVYFPESDYKRPLGVPLKNGFDFSYNRFGKLRERKSRGHISTCNCH